MSHFYHSSKAAYALDEEQRREAKAVEGNVEMQGPMKLTQEVRTRWNSTFHMLGRLLELQQPVRRVLADELRDDLQLTREELIVIQDAVIALNTFDEVTKEMSAEKTSSVSKVIPITRGLGETLKQMETSLRRKRTGATAATKKIPKAGGVHFMGNSYISRPQVHASCVHGKRCRGSCQKESFRTVPQTTGDNIHCQR